MTITRPSKRHTLIVSLILMLCTVLMIPFSPSASAGVHLNNLGVHRELSGHEATLWARKYLWYLGAPRTNANIRTMVAWFDNEGTPRCFNNPLGLQTSEAGSHTCTSNGDPTADHIQAYPRPYLSAQAFKREMLHGGPDNNGDYHRIVSDLRSGHGMIGDHSNALRYDLSQYSGGGYESIPAAYCPC